MKKCHMIIQYNHYYNTLFKLTWSILSIPKKKKLLTPSKDYYFTNTYFKTEIEYKIIQG